VKVETMTTLRRLDEDHRPPLNSMLVYQTLNGDIYGITNIGNGRWYVTGSDVPWQWRELWDALNKGEPITLLALFMNGDEA
jgi:hypothetical protein